MLKKYNIRNSLLKKKETFLIVMEITSANVEFIMVCRFKFFSFSYTVWRNYSGSVHEIIPYKLSSYTLGAELKF